MALYAYNLTGSPVALAAGSPIVTLPASASPPSKGKAYNVTSELRPNLTVDPVNGKTGGLPASDYLLLQAQVDPGTVVFEWSAEPEYLTPGLTVLGPADVDPNVVKATTAILHVYANGTTGNDANNGFTVGTPKLTLQAVCDLIPYYVNHNVCVHLSGTFADAGNIAFEKLVATGRVAVIDGGTGLTPVDMIVGRGDSLVVAGPAPMSVVTLTDAGANFTQNLVGRIIVTTGSTNVPPIEFAWTIASVISPTQLTFTDWFGGHATEAVYGGYYYIYPADTVVAGTGDTLAAAGGIVTLTDAGASFTSIDIGKQITIAGATTPGHNGTFTIATVVDMNNITYANGAGGLPVSEPFPGTWSMGGFLATAADPAWLQGPTTWERDQYVGTMIQIMSGPAIGENRLCTGYDTPVLNAAPLSGVAGTIAFNPIGTVCTLTDPAAAFNQLMVGRDVTITLSGLGNNGTFVITSVTSATSLTYVNVAGVNEAGLTWTLQRDFVYNPVGNIVTLSDAGAEFSPRLVGKNITIAGSTSPGNAGTFVVTSVVSPTQLTYVNAAPGVTEVFPAPGTWSTQGWITPVRDFSINPGALAEFRFVRPTTIIGNSAALNIRNLGRGIVQLQNVTMVDGAGVSFGDSPGQLRLSHFIGLNTWFNYLFLAFNSGDVGIDGARYNASTFALENAQPFSCMGLSSLLQVNGLPSIFANMIQNLKVNSSYIPLWPCYRSAPEVSYGTRVGCANLFAPEAINVHGVFGAIHNAAGYAITRFAGLDIHDMTGARNASLAIIGGSVVIYNNIDFTSVGDVALELNKGFVYYNDWGVYGLPSMMGVSAGMGMYAHNGSSFLINNTEATVPRLIGRAVGEVSADRTTQFTTWAAAGVSTAVDPTELTIVKRGYTSLI